MTEWYQEQLVQPEVFEINARVGIVVETKHIQILAEVKDPMAGVLIAQWSIPHEPIDNWGLVLDRLHEKLTQYCGDVIPPF